MGLSVIVASLTVVLPAAPGGPSKVNPRDGLTYQWIPPGSYFTGCLPGDTECYGLERHREKIVVDNGFWIGRTEVTQAAYMRVMSADPSYYKGADRPADRVGGRTRRPTAAGSACSCPRSRSGNMPLTEELQNCRRSRWYP